MDKSEVVHAMRTFGGGFVIKLALALEVADSENTRILCDAFKSRYPQFFPGGWAYKEVSKKG